ncbi:MAG TPA: cytochrome c [Vicinamibacterales bacterium]|jgi:mono/diheme cytochrome c family protein|nr:cytochrome c [Vicinamibacterales bacterium]
MKRVALVISLIALAPPVAAQSAASADSLDNGKRVYEKWCLPCHGARVATGFPGTSNGMYPGTAALAIKYKGALPPLLTERTDLAREFVLTVVREGLFGMPRTRKTEINDAELDEVAAYLTQKGKK